MAHAFLMAGGDVRVIQRCTKVQYATLQEARRALGKQRRKDTGLVSVGQGKLNAYKCKICKDYYHIGHM
jgi:hypothetical protein